MSNEEKITPEEEAELEAIEAGTLTPEQEAALDNVRPWDEAEPCWEMRFRAIGRLVAMLVTTVAAWFGFAVDEDGLFLVVVCALSIAAMVWGWWKDSPMTRAAQEGQTITRIVKAFGKEAADD